MSPSEVGGRRTRRRTVTVHGEQVGFWESLPHPESHDASASDGEVLLLVHGIAGSAHTWGPVLAELARRRDPRRVIVPDLVARMAEHSDLGPGSATGPRPSSPVLQRALVVAEAQRRGIASRVTVEQAVGILTHADPVPLDDARRRPDDHAEGAGRDLAELAADIVAGRLDPRSGAEPPDDGPRQTMTDAVVASARRTDAHD